MPRKYIGGKLNMEAFSTWEHRSFPDKHIPDYSALAEDFPHLQYEIEAEGCLADIGPRGPVRPIFDADDSEETGRRASRSPEDPDEKNEEDHPQNKRERKAQYPDRWYPEAELLSIDSMDVCPFIGRSPKRCHLNIYKDGRLNEKQLVTRGAPCCTGC